MSGPVGRVSFGPYVLDERSRELLRGPRRAPVHLTGKGIDTLLLLVAERPRALSKQEILDRVWPDCFVADATLASVIAELRRALGESGRKASYVRTVHGFGYAFSADVVEDTRDAQVVEPAPVACWLVNDASEWPLAEGEHLIGRSAPATVLLASRTVSRRHATLAVRKGTATLVDLCSKNGTLLNGQVMTSPSVVADGDRIGIGVFTLIFRAIDGTTVTTQQEQ